MFFTVSKNISYLQKKKSKWQAWAHTEWPIDKWKCMWQIILSKDSGNNILHPTCSFCSVTLTSFQLKIEPLPPSLQTSWVVLTIYVTGGWQKSCSEAGSYKMTMPHRHNFCFIYLLEHSLFCFSFFFFSVFLSLCWDGVLKNSCSQDWPWTTDPLASPSTVLGITTGCHEDQPGLVCL